MFARATSETTKDIYVHSRHGPAQEEHTKAVTAW